MFEPVRELAAKARQEDRKLSPHHVYEGTRHWTAPWSCDKCGGNMIGVGNSAPWCSNPSCDYPSPLQKARSAR